MTERCRRVVVAVLCFAVLWTAGCSGRTRPRIHGKVIYNNNPVGGQTLVLVSEGEVQEAFRHKIVIDPDGTFSGEAPQPGKYWVVIEPPLSAQEGSKSSTVMPVPKKYRTRDSTDETWEIKDGDNQKEIVLQD